MISRVSRGRAAGASDRIVGRVGVPAPDAFPLDVGHHSCSTGPPAPQACEGIDDDSQLLAPRPTMHLSSDRQSSFTDGRLATGLIKTTIQNGARPSEHNFADASDIDARSAARYLM